MWNNKRKALTFSFDDGVEQDIRTIEILNRYGLKGTFNLNSNRFGVHYHGKGRMGNEFHRVMITEERIKEIYAGHEVAVHTLDHTNLTTVDDAEVIRQVDEDRKALERIVGYPVRGMAYPCGGVNNDERVANLIKAHTPIGYARTITSSRSFDRQTNLLQFQPTEYFYCVDSLFELAKKFLEMDAPAQPQLFYIWGHTYEMDEGGSISWEQFEELCRMLSGKEDIFYGTNAEVLL